QIYSFDGAALTLISGAQIDYGTTVHSVNWRPDGRYLAIGGQTPGAGHEEIEVYKCDFVNSTTTQALSNSIVFGQSAQGSSYDARVNALAGAHVLLSGSMSYDSVSGLLGDEEW
ncbi:MAG: hypothetical protein WCW33_06370, partial [Candidatus Babeliales bacterium]